MKIKELENQIEMLEKEKEENIKNARYEAAAYNRDKLRKLKEKLSVLKKLS